MGDGPDRGGLPYWARFGLLVAAALAVLFTVVFAVFPQRFVLAPGLREQDLNFPVDAPAFELPRRTALFRPRPPAEEPPERPPRGPEERFWDRVTDLTEAGRDEAALPHFRRWLEGHPDDHDVRLEYARALERAGRLGAAGEAYGRVARATGRRAATLERARVLSRLGRHRAAARHYRELLERTPGDAGLRLALARALHASGSPAAAWRQARRVPAGSPAGAAAAELREVLRAEMPLPAAATVTGAPRARARAAAAAGELRAAERLYRIALLLDPGDLSARLELAELLATRREAPAEAARLLAAVAGAVADPSSNRFEEGRGEGRPGAAPAELRRRLARYRLWAGDDDAALRVLRGLRDDGAATADDLALAGDLLRWRGRRVAADDLYAAALEREPDNGRALKGRAALRAETRRVVEARDPTGAGVVSDAYADSDDFATWSVAGRAVLDPGGEGTHRLEARSGVRWLRGPSAAGPVRREAGPVGGLTWVGWWRQATVRTAVRAGVEQIDPAGTEPVVGAEVTVPGLGLEAGYRHGPAHPTTLTFASVQDRTRMDRVRASLYRSPGGGPWGLWTSVEAASLRGGGVDNGRLVAQATLDRPVALDGLLRAGYATRLLATGEPAPVTAAGAPAYWSPGLSWSHGLRLALRRPRGETGWGWRVEARPGLAMVRLHGDGRAPEPGTELELRFAGETGLEYRGEDAAARLQATYLRSRADGYRAVGGSLELLWRF